jgi:hypothetical protein
MVWIDLLSRGRSSQNVCNDSFDDSSLRQLQENPVSREGKEARTELFRRIADNDELFHQLQRELRSRNRSHRGLMTNTGVAVVLAENQSQLIEKMGRAVIEHGARARKEKKGTVEVEDYSGTGEFTFRAEKLSAWAKVQISQKNMNSKNGSDSMKHQEPLYVPSPVTSYIVVERQVSWPAKASNFSRKSFNTLSRGILSRALSGKSPYGIAGKAA